ncbi:hypothetical protein [Novosphingobium sp. MBES04]|uniref:hypothetical protein n=1 Tax=Novosphingobium sp. MBES04 TaxID=1206458 RepID=UPI0011859F00|nr:hypothetical protein [Novosphingobium sp. MBES04]
MGDVLFKGDVQLVGQADGERGDRSALVHVHGIDQLGPPRNLHRRARRGQTQPRQIGVERGQVGRQDLLGPIQIPRRNPCRKPLRVVPLPLKGRESLLQPVNHL